MSDKLTAEQVRAAIFNGSGYASFDGAKYYADGIGMQAIADELNATLGNDGVGRTNDGVAERGTCHIEERNGDLYCDGCGEMVGTYDPTSELFIDGNAIELWEFCPRCGAEVIK